MRTLVATVLYNSKGQDIYCTAKKVSDQQIERIKGLDRGVLEEAGFTFIKLLSLEHANVKGYAIFFEGHLDEMNRVLNAIYKNYNTKW